MSSPCEECICLAVCRHKPYDTLINECIILYKRLHFVSGSRVKTYTSVLSETRSIMKPTKWYCIVAGNGHTILVRGEPNAAMSM